MSIGREGGGFGGAEGGELVPELWAVSAPVGGEGGAGGEGGEEPVEEEGGSVEKSRSALSSRVVIQPQAQLTSSQPVAPPLP